MNELTRHIKQVQDKLQQLLKQYQLVQKENSQLKTELSKVQENNAEQVKHIAELKQQLGVMRLNATGMNETEKKEMEKQINVYLKEIDRCIAMLGE